MNKIDPARLAQAFAAFMRPRQSPDQPLVLRKAVTTMLDFFAEERVETESDSLLFQWGTYDFGRGPSFQIGITRQVERPFEGEDDDEDEEDDDFEHNPLDDLELWQLRLTFYLPPSPRLAKLESGNRWCESLDELTAFREWLLDTPAFQALADESNVTFDFLYECAE